MQYNDSFIQNNLPRHYRGDKSDIGLWTLAHKFCVNSRSVHLLADYIASNLAPQFSLITKKGTVLIVFI